MKMTMLMLITLWGCWLSTAQQLSGQFKQWTQKEVRLEGFNGFSTYPIASVMTDLEGKFSLPYTTKDHGIGCLIADKGKPLFVILSSENTEFIGETPANSATAKVVKGRENRAFELYAKQQPKREQALSAWAYLEKLYQSDSLLSKQIVIQKSITNEKQRIIQEEADFLAKLPNNSYARWFLPLRKLLSNITSIAQYRTNEIPATLQALRNINYADERLYKSGLYRDAVDNHIWFIENSSGSLDSVFANINRSIDSMLQPLQKDNKKYNEFTNYLFDLLESRSLFGSSEYLALQVLSNNSCSVNKELANKLESYRKLKKGNTAPDIVFGQNTIFPKGSEVVNLRAMESPYKLVVFAASWCEHCQQALPKVAELYPKWKAKGMEVIYVSLDDNEKDFRAYAEKLPFLSTCDFKKWDGKAVSDYHVSGTPTYYLLNKDLEIVVKPISVEQINAWVEYVANNDN